MLLQRFATPTIPNVCAQYGIEYINNVEFIRRQKWNSYCLTKVELLGDLQVTAKYVRQLHLPGGLAFRLKQSWVSNKDAGASSTGCRHVESVYVVEKLHSTRSVIGR